MSDITTSTTDPVSYDPSTNRVAPPPFDDPTADVILRSADKVDFFAHRFILALVSPLFRDIFTLPAPDVESGTRQVIQLTENHPAVGLMLRLCYPLMDVDLEDFDVVQELLEMTQKYEIEPGFHRVRKSLVAPKFLDQHPLRVFATAYRYRLEDEARLAARHTLHHSLAMPYFHELEFIPTVVYHHLLEYRGRCSEALIDLTSPLNWLPIHAGSVWAICSSCPPGPYRVILNDGRGWIPRRWFVEYLERVKYLFRFQPSPQTALDPDIIQPSLEKAFACSICSRNALSDLLRFASLFAQQIQRVLSQVDLGISF